MADYRIKNDIVKQKKRFDPFNSPQEYPLKEAKKNSEKRRNIEKINPDLSGNIERSTFNPPMAEIKKNAWGKLRARVIFFMDISQVLLINVSIDLSRSNIGMAEHLLYAAQVGAAG